MRIIAGKYKGIRLLAPDGQDVRPTTDRIKESIFNILSSKKDFLGTSVLDIFSGSGALGIEALSRGAESVIFCDNNRASIALTRSNLSKIHSSATVLAGDFRLTLKKLSGNKFDFIFADPPYGAGFYGEIINLVEKYGLIAKNGIIILEHSALSDLIIDEKRYIIDCRKFGSVGAAFLTAKEEIEE